MSLEFRGALIRNVVIDADDTLFPLPDEFWRDIRMQALVAAGIDSDNLDDMNDKWLSEGLNPEIGWLRAYESYGGDPDTYRKIILSAEKTAHLEHDPDLVEVLRELRENVDRIIVFSGSNYWPVIDGLSVVLNDPLKILRMIDRVVTSDTLANGYMKPSKEAYLELLEIEYANKEKINPRETMFFDDQVKEIQTVASLELLGVLVGDHESSVAQASGAVEQIPRIHEIMQVFD